ncbi:TPA: YPDG domain-containing protein, partial [Streptococcus suis]
MSSKDMFRKEQRFSFRKFSFGLASAVIANVIFGGAIASSPIVHANTAEPTSTVVPSERLASVSYTVNVVDQAGAVINTQTKNVSVQTTEATAVATANLTTDLVPEGYALVSGLGQETVTENAENVFTVVVEKATSEVASTEDSAAVSASETSTSTATSETVSSTTVAASETSTKATSERANTAAVAVAAAETVPNKTERTAYLSYITHYVNEANETVDRRGHLVAVTTTDDTAKTQVTVSASENMPSGYELAQDKAEVVLQLVEKQTNVLVFAVTKKSKEEEIAESQLSNRDVLMRLSLEADLLADEALRQVAKEQAGNTALETAANDTKAAATAANQVLANAAATEVELDAQIDTVRTSTQNLAAEMLKVDKDGILTAMLDATQVSRPDSYSEVGTEAGPFHQNKPNLTRYLFIFGTSEGDTEDAWGAKGTPPVADKINASRALVPAGTITNIVYNDGTSNLTNGTLGSNLTMDTDGFLNGSYNHTAGGAYTRKLLVTTDTGTQRSNDFTTYAYTDKASSEPVKKLEGQTLTQDEVFGKMAIATTSTRFPNTGKNIPTVPTDEYTRTIVGYRLVTEDAYGNVTKGELVEQTDLAQFPTDKDYQVKVKTTNVYGQTIYNWVNVDYDLKASMPTIGVDPGVLVKNGDNRQLEALFVFGNVSGTTEAVSSAGGPAVPDFDTAKATKAFLATDPETEAAKAAIAEINANGSLTEEQKAEYIAKQEAKKENVTLAYGVPGNVTAYEAGKPETLTTNGHPPMSAETGNLGRENSNQLRLDAEGKLSGEFPVAPGGFYSRVVKMTDTAGNVSYSNPFFVVGYTDKRADNTDLTVAAASDLTEANIFGKLTIDVTSGSGNTNRSLTVPTSEYTRKIVGYRLTGTTAEQTLSTATLNTLPAGKNYEIKVETTNPYGQTIYNWVPVNDTRTEEVSKAELYAFNNSPIQTVSAGTYEADGVNKVKVVTVKDKDGVAAFTYYQTPSNVVAPINGIALTKQDNATDGTIEGYASGVPSVDIQGAYSRSFQVTDTNNNTEVVFASPNRQVSTILDTKVTGDVTKEAGQTPTKDEIFDKIQVLTSANRQPVVVPYSENGIFRRDLAPGQTLPTAPGEHNVVVRVVTASNVYKDVTVKVIIKAYKDVLEPAADENTSLVPGSGNAATQPIVINDATGTATTAPAGTTYAVDPTFLAVKEALGYTITVDANGNVSVVAPAGQESDIAVPVTVTYPDKTTDSVSVPFKVNQKDTAQLKAKEAIDKKLADETKALEDKKNAEIAAITNNPDLTPDQKDAAVKDITDAAEIAKKALNDAAGVAKDNVDAATTPEEAKAAQTAGETTLADLENGAEAALDLITAKAEAKDAIADKLADEVKELEAKQAEAEKAIDASTMTPEEKDAAKKALQDVVDAEKAKLEDAAKKATDAVDAA